ncbi:MAG: hypothetical protein CFH01_01678 [Alphaproteobacteria bacterium MarineAlpha2_Bin1]|nr:MAG: hypothetical protein CFH01_01678 [Alphaproteobacteria bacterium MarineAlpha2_Bin1]|tara:strand:+ start:148 stop:633 length:486 start_codon:yes stop_codon:yes gene_type:complete
MLIDSQNTDRKFKIIAYLVTGAGALPFILGLIFVITSENYNFFLFPIIIYSGLIISFVCGSNWVIIFLSVNSSERVSFNNYLIFILNSIIPIVLSWSIIFNASSNSEKYSFAYSGLLLISLLFFDIIFFFKSMIETWWLKLRIFASLSSSFSLISINIILL